MTHLRRLWSGGYSANYYAYMWSEVIEDDAYAWFTEHGGRDPVVGPLLEERGLVAARKGSR